LEYLDLRANLLITLPDELAQLTRLRKVDLRWNRLATYPPCLDALAKRDCIVYT